MLALKEFLKEKPLYYNEIDYTRMPRVYEKIKQYLPKVKIIHLIGTNGKGTTGRFLATALHNMGYKRVWINGENASYESLDMAHIKLQDILTKEDSNALSYFEYTTLLAMVLFEGCEYVILEAGLGGEHDATAVFEKVLTLVTPIDYDHESFLGSSIEEIATTKLKAIQKNAILATQKDEKIYDIAQNIESATGANVYRVDDLLVYADIEKINKISKNLELAYYLQDNLKLSISALKFLDIAYEAESFNNARLFGRLSKISDNILLDVGHNALAAKSILKELEGNRYTLVYNSYKDKDYKEILKTLKPIIKSVEIIDINDERIESEELLQRSLNELEIEYSTFKKINKNKNYLVFGSFSVAEAFLGRYNIDE